MLWKCNLQDGKRKCTLVWKACFFLIYPIILYLLSPQPMRLRQLSYIGLFWRKYFFFTLSFMLKDLSRSFVLVFHLFAVYPFPVWEHFFFIDAVCLVKTHVFSPFMLCSLLLKDRTCIFLCEIFASKNGKGLFILENK